MKRYKLQATRYTNGGFTLVEVLVSIALTALLSSFVLTYTNTGRAQVVLYIEEAKISQVLLRAKSLAISTYDKEVTNPTESLPCGYGVSVNYVERTYAIFSYSQQPSCDPIDFIDRSDSSPAYQEIESFALPPELEFDIDGVFGDDLDVVLFSPPDPKTWLWVNGLDTRNSEPASIYLRTKNGIATSRIEITAGGQVSAIR